MKKRYTVARNDGKVWRGPHCDYWWDTKTRELISVDPGVNPNKTNITELVLLALLFSMAIALACFVF